MKDEPPKQVSLITKPFNNLPEDVRERLVKTLAGEESPLLSLKMVDPHLNKVDKSIYVAITAAILLCVLAGYEFGVLGNGGLYGYQPLSFLAGYVLLFALFTVGVVGYFRNSKTVNLYPIEDGTYLLPFDMIFVDEGKITISPLATLKTVEINKDLTRYGFYRSTNIEFVFEDFKTGITVSDKSEAQRIIHHINESKKIAAAALKNGDSEKLREIDPLFCIKTANSWSVIPDKESDTVLQTGPLFGALPPFLQRRNLFRITAVIAVILGTLTWFARNSTSNQMALDDVLKLNSEAKYEEYLKQEYVLKRKEILMVNLPRAAFQEAVAAGNKSRIKEFIEKYPNSEYADQARVVLRQKTTSTVASKSGLK